MHHKPQKIVYRIQPKFLLGSGVLLAILGFFLWRYLLTPLKVAEVSQSQSGLCQTTLDKISFTDECGAPGTFRNMTYTCADGQTAQRKVEGDRCISYGELLADAQASCARCPSPSPTPTARPSTLPSPVPVSSTYPSPSPTSTSTSYYKVTNHPNPVNITCVEGDINCGFYLPVIYTNTTNYDLYQTAIWTDTPGVRFTDPKTNGQLTDQRVTLTNPIFFEPGYGPNIMVATKVTSDMKPGTHVRRVYIDAKTCNQIGDALDCYYGGSYGATTFTINLQVVPKPSPSPTPTPTPSSNNISCKLNLYRLPAGAKPNAPYQLLNSSGATVSPGDILIYDPVITNANSYPVGGRIKITTQNLSGKDEPISPTTYDEYCKFDNATKVFSCDLPYKQFSPNSSVGLSNAQFKARVLNTGRVSTGIMYSYQIGNVSGTCQPATMTMIALPTPTPTARPTYATCYRTCRTTGRPLLQCVRSCASR